MSMTNIALVFTSFGTILSIRDVCVVFSGGVIMDSWERCERNPF